MDPRVAEFQCIMPMENIPSVLVHGILSYERTSRLRHKSVAMQPVQDRRDAKRVPGGLMLHHYANLYFHARNPMMFSLKDQAAQLCVLRVSVEVAGLDGVVYSDRNASSDWVRFLHPSQWRVLDYDSIYSLDWRHPDHFEYYARKSKKCAEILVPHQVEARYLTGAYVVDQNAATRLVSNHGFFLPVSIDSQMFFR